MIFVGKAKQCFVYNTKIIETPTTKEVYFYETPIYSHSNSDSKTSNTQAHKRKVFDEMSAHKQYDSLKRKSKKHYEQTRWGLMGNICVSMHSREHVCMLRWKNFTEW